MMWGYDSMAWFWMLPMLLVVGGVVIAIILVLLRAVGTPTHPEDEALQALRRRLALGEISADEFDNIRGRLRS